jgi:hypothetical protein
MAQFIVDKLEEGKQAQWLSISKGLFELTEWHSIAKEWFGEKPRNSEEVDAPCMLRKGLPRAFPGLEEKKERSRKEGTQYRSRVFQAPHQLIQEVILHMNSHGGVPYMGTDHQYTEYSHPHYTNNSYIMQQPSSVNPQYATPSPAVIPYASNLQVKLEYPQVSCTSSSYPAQLLVHNGDQHYIPPTSSVPPLYSNAGASNIEIMANVIADDSMESHQYQNAAGQIPTDWQYSNNSSNSSSMIQIPASPQMYPSPPVYGAKGYIGGSPAQPPISPHVSPEPSVVHHHHLSSSSYPPSEQYHQGMNGPPHLDMSPSNVQSPVIVTEDVPEIMDVKVMPNSSPLEGGGFMALIFYQPLPLGNKVVYFVSSSTSPAYCMVQQATDENPHTLSCLIPKYPIAEQVELRVYCEQHQIAVTHFTFYQPFLPPSDMLLQILNSQLQQHFPLNQGNMANHSSQNVVSSAGGATYTGYSPSSMYQLLLGACRLGCQPLVHCLLCSPALEDVPGDVLEKAIYCAEENSHFELAESLKEIHLLHDMAIPPEHYRSRGTEELITPRHVPAYYDAIDQLDMGGDTPQECASSVLDQLVKAVKQASLDENDSSPPNGLGLDEGVAKNDSNDVTPTVEISAHLSLSSSSNDLKIEDNTPSRRRLSSNSRLTRQPHSSIHDNEEEEGEEEGNPSAITPTNTDIDTQLMPTIQYSRPSYCESADNVPELPTTYKKSVLNTQHSDAADSAIGMSFEEEISENGRRKSSQIYDSLLGHPIEACNIQIPQQDGVQVANSLQWESAIIVTEDFPPNPDKDKVLFMKGDQILKVGNNFTRNMSAVDFAELFQEEATSGTSVFVRPANRPESNIASNRLRPSDQFYTNMTSKVNHLLTMKLPRLDHALDHTHTILSVINSSERPVTLYQSSSGFGFKTIGGKTVGIFVSEIRPEISQLLSIGDQILTINEMSMADKTSYEVSQLIQNSPNQMEMTVVENKSKFAAIREQVEVDSFYLRCLVDHTPASNRDMVLKRGSLFKVINTSIYQPNHWLAWSVDETTRLETNLKKIPSPQQ